MLHTPLMSGTNAIHGIVLVGAMLIAGSADSTLEQALAFVAVVFATINIVGGFLVTDRMLEMFKRKPTKPDRNDDARAVADGDQLHIPRRRGAPHRRHPAALAPADGALGKL